MSLFRRVAILAVCLSGGPVLAGSDTYDASNMWGTQPGGATVEGALESAAMHVQNGIVAGQVNAAKRGLLYSSGSGESYNVYSIGSQSVVSNSITGSDNNVDINATQTSSNTGDVRNNGQINTGKNATNTNN